MNGSKRTKARTGSKKAPRETSEPLNGCAIALLGLVFGAVLLFGGMVVMSFVGARHEAVLGAKDHMAVFTAADLAGGFPGLQVSVTNEEIERSQSWGGSWEFNYSNFFRAASGEALVVQSTMSIERSTFAAKRTYQSLTMGMGIGRRFVLGGTVGTKDRSDLFSWGDESHFSELTNEGRPVGNVFRARSGLRVMRVRIIGLHMADSVTATTVLRPALRRMFAYDPEPAERAQDESDGASQP